MSTKTDLTENCNCPAEALTLLHKQATYDEHQHVIPAECKTCGEKWEYVYNEAGIRDPKTGEYNETF